MQLTKVFWIMFLVVMGLWLAIATWLVPAVIESAYRGESLEILNRILSGRGEHPLDHYLGLWKRLSHSVPLVLLGLGVLLYVALLFRHRLVRFWLKSYQTWRSLGLIPLRARDIVAIAMWFGLVAGLSEALAVILKQRISSYPGWGFSEDVLWMAPLAASLTFVIVALPLALVAKRWPALVPFPVLIFAYALLGWYSFLSLPEGGLVPGLHPYAVLLIAVGAAVRVAQVCARKAQSITSITRRTIPWLTVGVIVLGAGMRAWEWGHERFATSRLSALSGVPNVLLLVLDTVRAQDMSLYGYIRPTTPNIDARARSGVTFNRVVAPSPWTLPSHASLFSGRFHHDIIWKQPIPWAQPTLTETLAQHGYVTGGFAANLYYCIEYFGLDRGFQHYEDYPRSWQMIVSASWAPRRIANRVRKFLRLEDRDFVRKTAADVNRGFLDWVEQTNGLPFFAFLNYIDAHDPYYPPQPFDRRFTEPGIRARHRLGVTGHRYTGEEVRALRNSYDGAIAYIDHEIGSLLTELERRGVLDNTIVIITSDHGEEFNEHGVMGHSMSLYLPSLNVPLVILSPSRVPRDIRIDQPVSLLDVPATILDLIGLDSHNLISGLPLTRLWTEGDSTISSSIILSEALAKQDFTPPPSYPIHHGLMRSLVVDNLHYIQDGLGREELFDIVADPWEQVDLASLSNQAGQLERFRALLTTAFGDER